MYRRILPLLIASIILIACQPVQRQGYIPWRYADLRALDPAESDVASQDLVAVSVRRLSSDLQFRLDLLDIQPEIDHDLYLAFDLTPAGQRILPFQAEGQVDWDMLLAIPASGELSAERSDGSHPSGLKLRVMRDPTNDTVVVSFDRKTLGPGWPGAQVEIFLTPAGSASVSDRVQVVSLGDMAPPQTPILIGFWNTYPADTPAQALRRWNGAHSGPNSERNGLYGLLSAVQSTGVPVFLFDLKTPSSLSALDYLGALPLVRNLAGLGLLGLPDTVPFAWIPQDAPLQPAPEIVSRLAEESRQSALRFDLPASLHLFTSEASPQTKRAYQVIFSQSALHEGSGEPESTGPMWMHRIEIESRRQTAFISLPEGLDLPFGELNGLDVQDPSQSPPLELRKLLADAAYAHATGESDEIVLLGGDLPRTQWGNPYIALQMLEYISKRPWLKPLTPAELDSLSIPRPITLSQAFNSGGSIGRKEVSRVSGSSERRSLFTPQESPVPSGLTSGQVEELILTALRNAPAGRAKDLTWQAYRSLLSPAHPSTSSLAYLRQGYLGQVGFLLLASDWEAGNFPATCPAEEVFVCAFSHDADWDGLPEYGLASENWLALFEAEGGYLVYGFIRDEDGFHEVIGPSSQLQVGLSDPSLWKPERGVAGDPAQFRGAFSDLLPGRSAPGWSPMQVEISPGRLSFAAADGSIRKTFSLEGSDLVAQYESDGELRVQIPLVIDPWLRFSPGWGKRYRPVEAPGGWGWELAGAPAVLVETDGNIFARSFIDSADVIGKPEDPGYEYPPGHFLPFPIALVEIEGEGIFQIRLKVR